MRPPQQPEQEPKITKLNMNDESDAAPLSHVSEARDLKKVHLGRFNVAINQIFEGASPTGSPRPKEELNAWLVILLLSDIEKRNLPRWFLVLKSAIIACRFGRLRPCAHSGDIIGIAQWPKTLALLRARSCGIGALIDRDLIL